MTTQMKNRIWWLLPLALMIAIWFFSSRPSDESSMMSTEVILALLRIIERFSPGIDRDFWTQVLSYPVRKLAHMTEFTAFYGSLILAMRKNGVGNNAFKALGLTFLYACMDEYHQTFVPGRVGCVEDVMIDCLLPLILLLVHLAGWQRRKKDKS